MKVLFIGLGSAGQRHLRNIKRLLGNEAVISAYRVRSFERVFDDNLKILPEKTLAETYNIQEFYDLSDALSQKPDVTIISNPNSMHIQCALEAARAGSDLFIEKPLSVNLEGVEELKRVVSKNKLKAYVGFQNRFHPAVQKVKQILDEKKLGNLISVHCEIGELLNKMHTYEDYRSMNESQRSTGGGVVLCQIHELDYLYWMFGMPKELVAFGGKNSHLEIDVEDHAVTLCKYKQNTYEFPVIIQQDFLQTPPVRTCKIAGEYGKAELDLLKNECKISMINGDIEHHIYSEFTRNDMFLKEMEAFLNCVKTRESEFVGIEDGCASLKVALAIKESMAAGTLIQF